MEYETRTTRLVVVQKNETLYNESASTVSIEDEAAGEFVVVTQERGSIAINPDEWPTLRDAIGRMVDECRS